jgi:hypothetical protein
MRDGKLTMTSLARTAFAGGMPCRCAIALQAVSRPTRFFTRSLTTSPTRDVVLPRMASARKRIHQMHLSWPTNRPPTVEQTTHGILVALFKRRAIRAQGEPHPFPPARFRSYRTYRATRGRTSACSQRASRMSIRTKCICWLQNPSDANARPKTSVPQFGYIVAVCSTLHADVSSAFRA